MADIVLDPPFPRNRPLPRVKPLYRKGEKTELVHELDAPETKEDLVRAELREFMFNLANREDRRELQAYEKEQILGIFEDWLTTLPDSAWERAIDEEINTADRVIKGEQVIIWTADDQGGWQVEHYPTGLKTSAKSRNEARQFLSKELGKLVRSWRQLPSLSRVVGEIKQELATEFYTSF